jgi:hypothetical protein
MHARTLPLAALAAAALALAGPAQAAHYRGRNVDDHTFHGRAFTNDYGRFEHLEIRFQSDRAILLFPSGLRIVLALEDEEITDPRSIPAYDHKRGIRWEIDVIDMNQG